MEKRFRYVPPGSAGSVPQPSGGAAKGYFSGLRAPNAADSADKADILPTRAEMSATVKAAARAAASRVSGDRSASAAAAEKSKSGGGGRRDKIERDIFAARPSRGQALGVSAGGYDVYPETGDFETYDSDEVRMLRCIKRQERRKEAVVFSVLFFASAAF